MSAALELRHVAPVVEQIAKRLVVGDFRSPAGMGVALGGVRHLQIGVDRPETVRIDLDLDVGELPMPAGLAFVPRMLQTQPESIGALSTMLKDVDTALSVAREADAPLPVTAARRTALAKGQAPFASVLSCADSRVPPEVIFHQGLGDLFVVRAAGQVTDKSVIASLEYAAEHLHSPLIVVMGHESCGAVKAAMETPATTSLGVNLDYLLKAIRPSVAAVAGEAEGARFRAAILKNVEESLNDLVDGSPILKKMLEEREIGLVGACDAANAATIFPLCTGVQGNGDGILQLTGRVRDGRQGTVDGSEVRQDNRHVANRHLAAHHVHSADDEHERRAENRDGAHDHAKQRLLPGDRDAGVHRRLARARVAVGLVRLAREALDESHRRERLVELPRVAFDDEHVAVALRVRATFDGRVRRDGIRPGVALIAILEAHRHWRLLAVHHHVGDAARCTLPYRAEVWVQPFVEADAGDDGIGVRVHGVGRDVAVPRIVVGKRTAALERDIRSEGNWLSSEG